MDPVLSITRENFDTCEVNNNVASKLVLPIASRTYLLEPSRKQVTDLYNSMHATAFISKFFLNCELILLPFCFKRRGQYGTTEKKTTTRASNTDIMLVKNSAIRLQEIRVEFIICE
jgi:hypothetical protein